MKLNLRNSVVISLVIGSASLFSCTVDSNGEESGGAGGTAGSGLGGSGGTGNAPSQGGSGGMQATSGGTAGTAGAAGTAGTLGEVDCGDVQDEPAASCDAASTMIQDADCAACVEEECCEDDPSGEYTGFMACAGSDPRNACAFGGKQGEGELECVRACAAEKFADGELTVATLAECGSDCASTCDGVQSTLTSTTIVCLDTHCATECFGGPLPKQ